MTVNRAQAALELDRAQQRLSALLLAARRDLPAIIEAADVVRCLERQATETERRAA